VSALPVARSLMCCAMHQKSAANAVSKHIPLPILCHALTLKYMLALHSCLPACCMARLT
jgi:hypothetical protein